MRAWIIPIPLFTLLLAGSVSALQIPGKMPLGPIPEAPPEHPPAAPCDGCCGGALGLPNVYLHSGEFHLSEVDLVIRGRGIDFVWGRRYRSRLGRDTQQGNGWDFSYNLSIQDAGPDHLRLRDGNGRSDLYRRRADGTYVAHQFFREGMFNPDGSFTLMFADGGRWVFLPLDGGVAQGKIQSIADRNGNTLSFTYGPFQGTLLRITDTLGRFIHLSYTSAGKIAAITDFVGRQVVYGYYQEGEEEGSPGDLKSVRSPTVTGTPNGNDFPAGKTTTYSYSKGFADERLNHNLLSITDPKGQTWLTNTYSGEQEPWKLGFDRLIRQERGDPGDVIDVTYLLLSPRPATTSSTHATPLVARRSKAIVNDRVGNVKEFTYDERGRCVRLRELTGRADPDLPTSSIANRPVAPLRPGDPPWFDTVYEHNQDSQVTRIVHPNGNITQKVYELELDPAAPWRSRGNLRALVRLPGSYTPVGDQPKITQLFEYEGGFGGCCNSNFVTRHTDARGNVTQHEYDPNGNRIQTIHRIPSIVEDFDYNQYGQLITHVWPENGSGWRQTDTFTYYGPAAGVQNGYKESEVLDSLGHQLTTTWVYDAVGNPVQVTDARGQVHTNTFNELDQEVRGLSPPVSMMNGTIVQYEVDTFFDANDNVVRVDEKNFDDQGIHSAANPYFTTSFDREVLNQVTRRTEEVDPSTDVVTEYGYDANRNRILERSGESVCGAQPFNVIQYVHDERDLLFEKIRGAGGPYQSTTQYDYDGNRKILATLRGVEGSPRVTMEVFDAYGRSIVSTDPMENVLTRNYDPNSNIVRMRVHGELCDESGGSANVLLYEANMSYDAMDRLTKSEVRHFDPTSGAPIGDGVSRSLVGWTDRTEMAFVTDDNDNTTTYSYDTVNRLALVVDAAGNSSCRIYDAHHNLVRLTETEQPDLAGTPVQVIETNWTYDAVERPVSAFDFAEGELQSGYDSRSNLTLVVDALGNVTNSTFDGLDRLRTCDRIMTDDGTGAGAPIGRISRQWDWDCNSRLVGVTDDNGNATLYGYDDLNRRTDIAFGDGTSERQVFDVHGNVLQKTDANGTQVTSTYDELDRISQRAIDPGPGVSSETTSETWKHDGLSRVVLAQDDDSLVTRAYDSLSNMTSETQGGKAITCVHDGVGNELSSTYPGGKVVTRTFDSLNRIKTVFNAGPTASYDYFGPSRIQLRTTGDGVATSAYAYDIVRRVVSIDHQVGTQAIDQRAFLWDAQYNKIQARDTRVGGRMSTIDYTYDSHYRLTRAHETSPTGTTLGDTQYTLDGVGNRMGVSGGGCPGTYVMDATIPEPADLQVNQYTSTPCVGVIDYDANGNEVLLGGADVLIRNCHDRVVVHNIPGSSTTVHKYDAFGRLIAKLGLLAGTETHFYYAGADVVEERNAQDVVVAEYVRGARDEIVEMVAGGSRYFFLSDDLMSTRAVVDEQGVVVERYEYGDFGAPTFLDAAGMQIGQSSIGNHYLFTGQRYDAESGFYDYKARHFDPQNGRFLGRDPIGIWGDAINLGNGRTYAANNPQTFTDPTGLYTDVASCSGPSGSETVRWSRQDCTSWDAGRIDEALCAAAQGAKMADRAAGKWLAFELTGYPTAGWVTAIWGWVNIPFSEWFAGPNGTMNNYSKVLIRDTVRDIFRPFRDHRTVTFECESGNGPGNDCGENNVAYVYGSGSDVHLCPKWKPLGAKRRGSVILHEYAHKFGGADDHFYYWSQTDPAQYKTQWGFPVANTFETNTLATNADTYQGMIEKWFMK